MTVITGLFLAFIGFRIRSRGDVHLIAGYDSGRVTDAAGLGRLVGGVCIALGVAALAAAGALLAWPGGEGILMIGFAVVVIAGIVVIFARRGKYERTRSSVVPTNSRKPVIPDQDR